MGVYPWKDHLICADCKKRFPLKSSFLEIPDHIDSHRAARRPPEMLDCVRIQCVDKGCSFFGVDVGADIYRLGDRLVVEWHSDSPMCKHMWERAKAYIDLELKRHSGELPSDEMLSWWCPYCITRIPRTSEKCPNCGVDLSKQLPPQFKAAAAQLERVYAIHKKDKDANTSRS
jgi:hypothetical protein